MNEVRVRIAPSPTGFAHVGTAYTALFNYAFARHNEGKFIIRIEDSDLKRNIDGADQKIYEALEWLGIEWDEGTTKGGKFGPYRLSERLDLYKKKAEDLIKIDMAYIDDGAIRFRNPGQKVSWDDLIRGKIEFPGEEITDFVIMKSDGYPTYNFNVVIDDISMQISHVIRGEDHVSNTPRQIALYRAFGVEPPRFAHHPMLLNSKRQKLSKRDAAVDIQEYKKQGILPQAFINFLGLMGWSHPEDKEIFDIDEYVDKFDFNRARKSGAIFDTVKLLWINQQYIQNLDQHKLSKLVFEFYEEKYSFETVTKTIPIIQSRIKTLSEYETLCKFFFEEPEIVNTSLFGIDFKSHVSLAFVSLSKLNFWTLDNINNSLSKLVTDNKIKIGDFYMSLRIAITGSKSTPPINESIEILGKEETMKRLKKII